MVVPEGARDTRDLPWQSDCRNDIVVPGGWLVLENSHFRRLTTVAGEANVKDTIYGADCVVERRDSVPITLTGQERDKQDPKKDNGCVDHDLPLGVGG